MSKPNDEQFAHVLIRMLQDDLRRARVSRVRAAVTSWMAEEVAAHSRKLDVCDETRREMQDAASDARTQLRLQREGAFATSPVSADELEGGFRVPPERPPAPQPRKTATGVATAQSA